MSYESEITPVDMFSIVTILIVVGLISLFLFFMLRSIGGNIEDNALKRAATELGENVLTSSITDNGVFLLSKLEEIDKTYAEIVKHCYAHRVRITSSQKINNKVVWEFGYSGGERDYSIEMPVSITAGDKMIPAKFELTVFDTFSTRCK